MPGTSHKENKKDPSCGFSPSRVCSNAGVLLEGKGFLFLFLPNLGRLPEGGGSQTWREKLQFLSKTI